MKKPKPSCALCGELPQEHRVFDSVVEGFLGGNSIHEIALDMSIEIPFVEECVRAEMIRLRKGQSRKDFWAMRALKATRK